MRGSIQSFSFIMIIVNTPLVATSNIRVSNWLHPISEVSWPHVSSRLGVNNSTFFVHFPKQWGYTSKSLLMVEKRIPRMALRRPKKGAKRTDYDRMCSMGYSKPLPSPSNMTILGSFFGSSRLGTPIFYRPQSAAPKERLFQAYVQRTPSFVQAVDLLTSKGGEIHNVTWP